MIRPNKTEQGPEKMLFYLLRALFCREKPPAGGYDFVKSYGKTLVNQGVCKKKLHIHFDTHCIKIGVQLWCGWRDLPACGRSGGAGKPSNRPFSNTRPSSTISETKKNSTQMVLFFWCGWRDLNPHEIAFTWTWTMRVCQFRHIRDCKSYYTKKVGICQHLFWIILRFS